MATISENLEALKTAKTNIKNAIEGKGQDLTDVPFTQYGEKIEAIQTSNIDLSETTATADDVLEGKEFFNASGEKVAGTYKDMLQQRIDINPNMAYLFQLYQYNDLTYLDKLDTSKVVSMYYMFDNAGTSSQPLTFPKIDTSNVTNMSYMFRGAYVKDVSNLNTSKATNMSYMFNDSKKLTSIPQLDTSKATNMSYMFSSSEIETVPILDTTSATNIQYLFSNCRKLVTVQGLDTSRITNLSNLFANCYLLETTPLLDMISATTVSSMFNGCRALTNLNLKNVKISLTIGSGTSYGHLLTLDSLLNTIQELWTNTGTSTRTLTMGTANTAKLANVYVKLIDITDEMRAEDEYIDNKAPFVQCESTDEGAMLITEYVTTVKNWQLA